MITKWYPNREDPQLGVFIQKHAQAISLKDDIVVLYIHSAKNLIAKFDCELNTSDNISEIIIYFRKNNSMFSKIINSLNYFRAFKLGLSYSGTDKKKPDIIHSYILVRTGIIAWYYSRKWKIPFIISEQWSGYVTGKFLASAWIRKKSVNYIVRKAKAITSVSDFLLKGMHRCGLKNKIEKVIPNVIETNHSISNISNKEFVQVLLVADLVDEIKNISGVIKMIAYLPREMRVILKIVGGGPDEKKLKQLTEENGLINRKIFFEGLKKNSEVYQYLSECDFLIMNSRFETFSLICAEAMSCGKPVLATRCGGPDEFINSDCGILIEPDDTESLKRNFEFMINNYDKFDPIKIKTHVINRFSKEIISKSFHDLYSALLNFRDNSAGNR
jgi:glycosyltransferase involved in cell wall biosynthesis